MKRSAKRIISIKVELKCLGCGRKMIVSQGESLRELFILEKVFCRIHRRCQRDNKSGAPVSRKEAFKILRRQEAERDKGARLEGDKP